jgi:SulP family sulfate permease
MKNKILQNWKSGFTVSLVSIPLSLALAIASGATPTQGIITAFWAGLLGAILGSSNFNIIGPTGALSGILISYSLMYGYESLPIIAILSGFLILLCFLLKLDKYIIFIPRSVVHGFTLGVAFVIGLGQLDNALGLQDIPKTEFFLQNLWISVQHIAEMQWIVLGMFVLGVSFIFFWNKNFSKIPGAIILAFVSIAVMIFLQSLNINVSLTTLGDKYPELQSSFFHNIFPVFSWEILLNKHVWILSVATAVISILETLLSGQIADSMTRTKFTHSKEVFALAMANIGSGLMGGIPATAALARTALNIKSGANSKISGIISAIFVGIISLFFLTYFKQMPMVVIASILTIVAIGMVEKRQYIHLIDNQKTAFFLAIFVALLVIVKDPMTGILVGTGIALFIFVKKVSYGQTEILIWENGKMIESVLKDAFIKRKDIHSDLIVYKISGILTYINMPAHLKAIEKIKNNKYVILSLRHSFYADIDGVDYLKEIVEILDSNNDHVLLTGINAELGKFLYRKKFYKEKQKQGYVFHRTSEALDTILKKS